MKIMITAGGTGGHIFPGLAVAESFLQQGNSVVWVGTAHGLETTLVPEANIPLFTITMQGIRGKGLKRLFKAPWLIARSVWGAYKMIKRESPNVILGMGGYVTVPVGLAAWLCRVPFVIHEQNAIPGMSNKWLSHIASAVCESFPQTFSASQKAVYSGNPLRPAILSLPYKNRDSLSHPQHLLRLLVLGGSQGAHAINQVTPPLLARADTIQLWHQTGTIEFDMIENAYQTLNRVPYRVEPFIQDIAQAYEWADLVVCRAGATTVAELAAIGLPAVLIPAPQAVDDHQTANAKNLEKQGLAVILPQSELSCDRLFNDIQKFYQQLEYKAKMQIHSTRLDATAKVVEICRSVMK